MRRSSARHLALLGQRLYDPGLDGGFSAQPRQSALQVEPAGEPDETASPRRHPIHSRRESGLEHLAMPGQVIPGHPAGESQHVGPHQRLLIHAGFDSLNLVAELSRRRFADLRHDP